MLDEQDRTKATSSLNNLGEKTLRRIVREVIQTRPSGERADYPEDLALAIINEYDSELLEKKDIRMILVEECNKLEIHNLLKKIGKNRIIGQNKEDLIAEACIGRWVCGGRSALAFTRFFNFPDSMAGESCKTTRYERTEDVYVWQAAPSLHRYQKELKRKSEDNLINNNTNRCMFTLPTGSGKTRIVVEFLIDYINQCITNNDDYILEKAFLWIAHSEELCE